jgi:hypothetical protein
MSQTSLLEQLVRQAAQLSPTALEELLLALEGLRSAASPAQLSQSPPQEALTDPLTQPARVRTGCRGGKGHIEEKWIKGCGPYRYLRYYKGCENGRSRYGSVYLGKVFPDESAQR